MPSSWQRYQRIFSLSFSVVVLLLLREKLIAGAGLKSANIQGQALRLTPTGEIATPRFAALMRDAGGAKAAQFTMLPYPLAPFPNRWLMKAKIQLFGKGGFS